jgi:hypothetical protein
MGETELQVSHQRLSRQMFCIDAPISTAPAVEPARIDRRALGAFFFCGLAPSWGAVVDIFFACRVAVVAQGVGEELKADLCL